ncbi:MAG: 16S rRNA (cytidine(1402)-2'-O)-methyltransferase [Hyphomicrobiaceae bacterium]
MTKFEATEENAGDVRDPRGHDRIVARATEELKRRLSEPLPPGLYLVATPIGNLGDVTLRALACLANADHVYCEDTRHSRPMLAHFGIERSLRPYHEHNAHAERPRILALIAEGRSVALISDAGTPLVSDPGYKLVREALDAGCDVKALPGASAVMCAIAVAGLPTDQFHFAGFLPPKQGQRLSRLSELGAIAGTVVLFEAPNRLPAALTDIVQALGADRPVVVARELTKRYEEVRRGTAGEVEAWARAAAVRGEVAILIGPAMHQEASEADIRAALAQIGGEKGLKEAAKIVAGRLGVARTRVYDIGLAMKSDNP